MHERLLLKRVRPAYRVSRWKKRLDERAGTLLARGYSPITVGNYLCRWVDFVREYEAEGAALPRDVRSPEVMGYLGRHWSRRSPTYGLVRVALRHLLHDMGEELRRLQPAKPPATVLFEKHGTTYLTFVLKHRGNRSLRGTERLLRTFFSWLDGRGIDDVARIQRSDVREFMASRNHLKRSTLSSEAAVLRCFLRYLGMQGLAPVGLPPMVESPRLYRMSSPPSVLEEEETLERLLAAVNRETPLGKRDYAMLLLGARYGLRPCDIRGLRLDDIRWREQRMVILQSKTQRALELPLTMDVDEALVDYLRHGRPATDAREVFVRHKVPVAPFVEGNNLWGVMQRAFNAAGIKPPPRNRGFYLLRHTVANRMLAKGVPFDTISDVLGHAFVDTTRIYAQVDLKGLRSVALSVTEICQ
jgi:site-specific recombinase XerD